MSDEDKFFTFISGLKLQVRNELCMQKVTDLPSVIITTESFADFKPPQGKAKNKGDKDKKPPIWLQTRRSWYRLVEVGEVRGC